MAPRAILVIPCYNEETRLHLDACRSFLNDHSRVNLLFVDDGSTDRTAVRLQLLRDELPERVEVVRLERNCGKAEAVRRGIMTALTRDTEFVGFWDADLATPLDVVELFLAEFDRRGHLEMVIGSRVQMLGRTIERRGVRHYTGRAFASIVSLILGMAVYDTQCGAKLFRTTPTLEAILSTPFLSRWAFDVEIIGRLAVERHRTPGLAPVDCISELPLPLWRDVAGSKLRPVDAFRVSRDLYRIHRWLRHSLDSRSDLG